MSHNLNRRRNKFDRMADSRFFRLAVILLFISLYACLIHRFNPTNVAYVSASTGKVTVVDNKGREVTNYVKGNGPKDAVYYETIIVE